MNHTNLPAQLREQTGKGVARRLRAQKMIPAVLYGPYTEKPLPIAVDPKALRAAVKTGHRLNTIMTLSLGDHGERTALLKDYQQDPISRELLHADFYEVVMDQPVTVRVPVTLKGRPAAVADGAVVSQNRREVDVTCLPNKIPEKIEIDISKMTPNQAIHVSDIAAPEGVKIRYVSDFAVVVLSAPEEAPAAPEPKAEAAS